MSTTQADCFRPNRKNPFRSKLAARLMRDDQRKNPPISLPGRPAIIDPPKPKPAPAPRATRAQFNYVASRQATHAEAEPHDIIGTWPRVRLLRMNARFVARVERAFRRGKESRTAATASMMPTSPHRRLIGAKRTLNDCQHAPQL